jgi:hypothetical protein
MAKNTCIYSQSNDIVYMSGEKIPDFEEQNEISLETKFIPREFLAIFAKVRQINTNLEDRSSCFYCGDEARCEDHVIPHSFLRHKGTRREGWEIDTLPACHECNSILSNQIFESLEERKSYLFEILERRKRKELKAKGWDSEEIEDLGYSLKSYVSVVYDNRILAEKRIEFLKDDSINIKSYLPNTYKSKVICKKIVKDRRLKKNGLTHAEVCERRANAIEKNMAKLQDKIPKNNTKIKHWRCVGGVWDFY